MFGEGALDALLIGEEKGGEAGVDGLRAVHVPVGLLGCCCTGERHQEKREKDSAHGSLILLGDHCRCKQNTGVLHCVQDDGEKRATAEAKEEADSQSK
jgi:hypothetical protein